MAKVVKERMSFWVWLGVVIGFISFLLFLLTDSEQEESHHYKRDRMDDLRFLEEWDLQDQLLEFEDDEE
ncbi:MAG: hypothetical protein ACLFVP_00020 [Candidatus Bathyarchaeia archaeon]